MLNFTLKKHTNLTTLKKIITIMISLFFSISFFIGLNISYEQSKIVSLILLIIYPILFLVFCYLVYFKRNSKLNIQRLKKRLLQKTKNKWAIKTIGFNFLFVLPAVIIYILNSYLSLAGYFFAKQPVTKLVTVESVNCHYSARGHSKLELIVSNNNQEKSTINFSYNMCKSFPNIIRLNGQSIKLYGRQWALGEIYEGFYYPKNIVLT